MLSSLISRDQIRNNQSAILLAILLIFGIGLRLWAIGFGLPELFHPDEDALIMPALNIIKTGDLEPIRMEYGTFHIYVLGVVSAAVFINSARNGRIANTGDLLIFERGSYPAVYQFPEYFLAARIVSAFMGTAAILLIYKLAQRLGNERQALIAAAIAAFLPDLVRHAHFATPDTPLLFWVTLSLYLLVRAYDNWETDNMWAYAGAAFVCGLATSVKYNGLILVFPLMMVPLLKIHQLEDWIRLRPLSGPLFMLAGFLAGTPYALLNIPEFLRWFGYSLRLYNAPAELAQPSWLWHLQFHLTSTHMIIFILGLVGFVVSFYYWGRRSLMINGFALLVWVAIVTQTNQQDRMWQPTAPIFMMWAALVLDLLIVYLQNRTPRTWSQKVQLAIPLLIIIPLFAFSIGVDVRYQQQDVRSLTSQWVQEHLPVGTRIAADYFAPNLDTQQYAVTKTFTLPDHDHTWYQENGIEYLMINEAITNPERLAGEKLERYNSLVNSVCLVETISGRFLAAKEIRTWIYKMPPCN